MSLYLINNAINDLGITGDIQVLYDFESYSGDAILSVEEGNSKYSGEVINFNSDFSGQSEGSGFFDGQYISIENANDITSEDITVIFSQRKTGASNGTIFSNLDQSGPSGWEVGINQANKLYFKNFVDGSPSYQTLDCYMSDQNLCAVSVSSDGIVELLRLNFANKEETPFSYNFLTDSQDPETVNYDFDRESLNIPSHSISNGSNWNIGSGEFLYHGFMDYFLMFDSFLSRDQISSISKSMYSSGEFIPSVSGQLSGEITGYTVSSSGVSGKVGSSLFVSGEQQQSGFYTYESGVALTGTVGLSGEIYIPYTGIEEIEGTNQIGQTIYKRVRNLAFAFSVSGSPESTVLPDFESSGSYWYFSGSSGEYDGQTGSGPVGNIFGITGFDIQELTGYITGFQKKLYGSSEVSGTAYEEFEYSPLYGPVENYLISGGYISRSQNANPEYYPNAISYVGDLSSGDFYEVIYDTSESISVNNKAIFSVDNKYNVSVFNMEDIEPAQTINFGMNGVAYFSGDATFSKNEYNFPTINIESGFYISGGKMYPKITGNNEDSAFYDVTNSGDKEVFNISSLSQYSSAPFTSIPIDQKQIFFNGIKIYSGINYIDDGGFFPSGHVTGSTGIYFSIPDYSGAVNVTGSGVDIITINHDEITPKGFLSFINGVRQENSSLIPHSKESDLLSGFNIKENKSPSYIMINGVKELKV